MRPDVIALFRDLADRSPEEREAYYAREAVPDALRVEVESLLKYDQDSRSLQGYIASAHRLMLEETDSQTRGVTIDPPDPAVPERIGRFVVTRLLGRGGMGHVYLTRDPVIDRPVAVKLIGSGLEDDRGRRRLLREARTAGRLLHPNIVTIFEAGEFDGRTFIAMEYVPGETLGSIIRRRAALSLQRRIEMVEGACAGLAHAHRAGVVHLDIKPDNLMLDESGVVKVLDFGISRLQSETRSTRHGGGTLRYMSPEQIQGKPIDHHSDVFSLGCALFELIAYAHAFNGTTGEIFRQITSGPAPSLLNVSPDSDRRLDDIIRRAMTLDPAQRYSDLEDMRTELAAVRASLDPASSMASVSSPSEAIAPAAPIADAQNLATVVLAPAPERRRTWLSSPRALAIAGLTKVVGAAIRVWKRHTRSRKRRD